MISGIVGDFPRWANYDSRDNEDESRDSMVDKPICDQSKARHHAFDG